MERVTIKRIAELAGVSVPAVSYVLNNKKGVSEQTRQRVLAIIEELNYTPNVNSRRLILQKSFNILVCLDDPVSTMDNLFYTEILSAIVAKGAELGYSIVLSNSGSENEREHFLQNISQHNADGVIFLRDISEELQKRMESYGMPYLVVDSHNTSSSYPCIASDVEQAAYDATSYLITHGHQKIAFIGMERVPAFYLNAFAGYKRALADQELSVQLDWIQSEAFDEASASTCMKRILESSSLPTAVFFTSDIFAIGAMNAVQERGYRIPEDISFIGMDDIILSRYCKPALTTMHIDKQKMGALAVEVLDHIVNNREVETSYRIPFERLIERETVCSI